MYLRGIFLYNMYGGIKSMFYVQKPEMVNKTFRLPEELVNRLAVVAQQQGVSMNNLVSQCCVYALDHLAEPETETPTRRDPR